MKIESAADAPSRLATWSIRVGLWLAVGLVGFGLGEAITRLFVPESIWRLHSADSDWVFDEELGWVQQPNMDVTGRADHAQVRFRTNPDGLTPETATRERSPGVTRIMLFGDSAVAGRWVPQDRTINAHLERILRSRGFSVEVFNAGVQGYATDQALLLLERMLPLYRPDIVTYGLHPNDFAGNVSRVAYSNAKPRLQLVEDGRLELLPLEATSRRLTERRGEGLRRLIQQSALYRVFQPFVFRARAKLGGWKDESMHGIGWEAIYFRTAELERFDWKLFGALVKRMQTSAEGQGARFLMYHHPDVAAIWEPYVQSVQRRYGDAAASYDRHALEKRLGATAAEQGVAFCPVVDYFLAAQERGPFHLLPRDFHCNSTGYEMTAELIASFLVSNGLLDVKGAAADSMTRSADRGRG